MADSVSVPRPDETQASGPDWFDANPFPTDFGKPPGPYQGGYTPGTYSGSFDPMQRTGALAQPYTPLQWTGGDYTTLAKPGSLQSEFAQPTAADVRATPGYQFTVDTGVKARDASAAQRGSLLSGGQQKALTQFGEDLGDTYYGNAFTRALQTRQQQRGDYQSDVGNAYQQYQTRYGVFNDMANRDLSARNMNENAFEFDAGQNAGAQQNRYAQFLNQEASLRGADTTNYGRYVDQNNAKRTSENDWWSRYQDQIRNGLSAANIARPPS